MRVIIADAHDLFRSLLKHWINSEPMMTLVADVADGSKVFQLVKEHAPELLLMDPILPNKSGSQLAREISISFPGLRMIALCQTSKPFVVDQIQRAGFHGCICKDNNTLETLQQAIESVADGNAYYCAQTCKTQNVLYNSNNSFVRLLSAREQEILVYIGAGMDNVEIGHKLKLSPATVQTHRRNLFRKLHIHDTPSLMRYAIEQGFWTPEGQ